MLKMKSKKILLVGGCGFIGHNLALNLKKLNHDVFVVDSLSINNLLSFTDSDIQNKSLYTGILNNRIDLISKNKLILLCKMPEIIMYAPGSMKINPDIIIHLAAVSHANKSNKDPHTTFDHSLRTLENTLDFAKSKKIHTIFLRVWFTEILMAWRFLKIHHVSQLEYMEV